MSPKLPIAHVRRLSVNTFRDVSRRTGPRDPKHIDCADKVKPNDVADSSFRQPDWSFLKNVSQVAGFTGFNPIIEGPNRFFGIRDFPVMRLGILMENRGEIRD